VAEAAGAARGLVEILDLDEARVGDRRDHDLRDPIAAPQRDRLAPRVQHDHRQLPAVVRIDRTGRVRQHEPVTQREPAARAHLRLVAVGHCDREPARHQRAVTRLEHELALERGVHVEARRTRCSARGQRQPPPARQSRDRNRDGRGGGAHWPIG